MTLHNKATNLCEIVNERQFPAMIHKRMAHSMCQIGDYVYCFGGMDEKQQMVSSVERIKLESQGKWEYVCELPAPMCNVGLLLTQN
jgi:N-acetylneuraminic acid mutarotase